ncbi:MULTISPECIES: hypothetical protein [unclassified Chryseobacterium]|uniref:hypothetical protein n=1 Tax=unclassified Chryseobacterium TaxID=2593645 RepID=UPI00226AB9BE|nr:MULTISPECIES: hypothetical protein [unclassified Chryseobacterium]
MNPRVLELLKNPKHIQSEDLGLLKEEINSFPYIQNIRALHLYGVHLFDKENYQKELSTTAAYTTDKKILYQLINGKIQQKEKPKPEVVVKVEKVEEQKEGVVKNNFQYVYKSSNFPLKREDKVQQIELNQEDLNQNLSIPVEPEAVIAEPENLEIVEDQESCEIQTSEVDANYIYVNGERNRILFEGEEDFMNETLADENAEFTPEVIINEDHISSEKVNETVNDEENISFHETESLNPETEVVENAEVENQETIEIQEETEKENVEIDSELNTTEEESVIEEEDHSTEEKDTQFTSETIIHEEEIASDHAEETIVEDDSELSFHGTDSFLPEIKIESERTETPIKEEDIIQPNINKHEDEMRRLIEEVEKKMKETKSVASEAKEETEPVGNHDISFAETQSFEVKHEEAKEENLVAEIVESIEKKEQSSEQIEETINENEAVSEVEEIKSAWKPMSFESHVPDSLLSKNQQVEVPKTEPVIVETPKVEEIKDEVKTEEVLPIVEDTPELIEDQAEEFKTPEEAVQEEKSSDSKEETPVMNVSFFGSDISSWKPTEPIKEEVKEEKPEEIKKVVEEKKLPNILDSNVPGFINTWQSWLKIDRPEEEDKQKTQIKTKAIETFIENNPRISQLKDESSYVVKEKTGDISHLMTETLANLYTEQKLYTKAIKAFEILIKKHPEKKEHFEAKIQEVKDIRTKN